MRVVALFLLLFFSHLLTAQNESCHLIIKVKNIKRVKGKLKLGVYNHNEAFLKDAVIWGDITISDTTAEYVFEGLDKGTYAVSIFQDENDNGELDSNFMGIPSEPYAFSNNAKGKFGPPSFEDCKFEVSRKRKEIVISF
ncbi:MAG: DUF2141 domain-containing protein [Bacteroidota bacterium]